MKDHLFITSNGDMLDTRRHDWAERPLRHGYARAGREFPTTPAGSIALRAAIRQKYAWPGGYEMIFTTADGAVLCGRCVQENYKQVAWSRNCNCNDGWLVDAMFLDCEVDDDDDVQCAHCYHDFRG